MEDGFDGNIDSIRQSFVFKIAQRLNTNFDRDYSTGLNLSDAYFFNSNASGILSELVEYKVIYQELTSPRCIELFKQFLNSEDNDLKTNVYILLANIVSKYNSNENFQKRINISSF